MKHSIMKTLWKKFIFLFSVLLLQSTSFCDVKTIGNFPIAANNQVIDGIIPDSKIQLPSEFEKESREKTENLLRFFRAPGQQFLPLGMYAMVYDMTDVEKLKQLQEHGINLSHKYLGRQTVRSALKDLRAAKEAGIGVMQNLPWVYLKTDDPSFWPNHISGLVDNRQIMIWYLPEEIKPKDLGYVKRIAEIIRQKDPYQRPIITFVNNYVPGYWEKHSTFVDALALGIYPAYDSGPRAGTKRAIDKAYSVGVPAVISALEVWEHKGIRTTPKEARFDAYLALISGAKGILWYSYNDAKKYPELMEAVFQIASELNGPDKLGEVFLNGKTPSSIKCRLLSGSPYAPPACAYENRNRKIKRVYSSLQWTAREHEGYLYIFAVNMNQKLGATDHGGEDKAVTVRFEKLLSVNDNVKVLFEDRQLTIKNNSFSDSFDPLGTHVYRLKIGHD